VGAALLTRYTELSGDNPAPSLVSFYKIYRANVRAKVAAIRAAQVWHGVACPSPTAVQYLDRADRYLGQLGPPLLIVVGGLMGTGKSTLASALADALPAPLLQTDQIRVELYGERDGREAYGAGRYAKTSRSRVYQEMSTRAKREFERSATVILDGTFGSAAERDLARNVACQQGAKILIVKCECPREEVLVRIRQRLQRGGDLSDARPELYDREAAEDSLGGDDGRVFSVDTTLGLTDQLDNVRIHLDGELFSD
jgi:predicted kinase